MSITRQVCKGDFRLQKFTIIQLGVLTFEKLVRRTPRIVGALKEKLKFCGIRYSMKL